MTAILYIHGFNSNGNSGKAAALRNGFTDCEVISPTMTHRADETAAAIMQEVSNLEARHAGRVVLVGTSMGGFWANWAASRKKLRAVIINPAIVPSETLRWAIGQKLEAGPVWSEQDCNDYQTYENEDTSGSRERFVVMVALDDEVIPPGPTIEHFGHYGEVRRYRQGGHRFDDYEEIRRRVYDVLGS